MTLLHLHRGESAAHEVLEELGAPSEALSLSAGRGQPCAGGSCSRQQQMGAAGAFGAEKGK